MNVEEIDLHGLKLEEAFQVFLDFYQYQLHNGKKRFTVIHGYGSSGEGGKIKNFLRAYLSKNMDKVTVYFGEEKYNNPGITEILPLKNLPSVMDMLGEKIIIFCNMPRTKEKIIGKFRQYGTDKVVEGIKKLEKNGFLQIVIKGRFKCYKNYL